MEGNGQEDNKSRLDRLEDAWNLMIRDHEEFRAEHKRLLTAQVVMQERLEGTRQLVHEIGDKLDALISWSETVQRENEARHLENEARSRELNDKFASLVSWSEKTQRENEDRFRRLEERQ